MPLSYGTAIPKRGLEKNCGSPILFYYCSIIHLFIKENTCSFLAHKPKSYKEKEVYSYGRNTREKSICFYATLGRQ